jgi:vitamin B12 transporter
MMSLSYGSYEDVEASGYYSNSIGKNNFLVHARAGFFDGYRLYPYEAFVAAGSVNNPARDHMGKDTALIGLKYMRDFDIGERARLEISAQHSYFKSDRANVAYLIGRHDQKDYTASIKWSHDVNRNFSYYFKLYYHDFAQYWSVIRPNGSIEGDKAPYGSQEYGFNIMTSYRFDRGDELILGIEYQDYWGEDMVVGFPTTPSERVWAGYLSFRPFLNFAPDWNNSLGIRFNKTSEHSVTVWNFSTKKPFFDDHFYIGASAGTTFRLPASEEMYINPGSLHAGNQYGDPNLKPQTSLGYTVNVGTTWDLIDFDVTYFYDAAKDRISSVVYGTYSKYENIPGKSIVQGYTLSSTIRPLSGLSVSLSFTEAQEKQLGRKVTFASWPKIYGHANVAYNFRAFDYPVLVSVDNNYTGHQYTTLNYIRYRYGDYWMTNFVTSVNFSENSQIALKINNLFDVKGSYGKGRIAAADYVYDILGTPFSAYITWTYSFN